MLTMSANGAWVWYYNTIASIWVYVHYFERTTTHSFGSKWSLVMWWTRFFWARASNHLFPLFFTTFKILRYVHLRFIVIHYLLLFGILFFLSFFLSPCLYFLFSFARGSFAHFSFVTFLNDPCPVILETMRFVEYISNHRLIERKRYWTKRVNGIWNWILCRFSLP